MAPASKKTEEWERQAVASALRRRGVPEVRPRREGLLLPSSKRHWDRWYALLRHYSFRLFLRDLIRLRSGARVEELARYCSPQVAADFVRALRVLRVVEVHGEVVRLRQGGIHSFGPTLEWFVAEVLRREFGMKVDWGLRPTGAAGGGDYDVIGLADGALVYVEVKSAAPRNIEVAQTRAFVGRVASLAPDVAIFLNDTQLRMLDKLVPAIQHELDTALPRAGRFERLEGEVFVAADRVFVTNSEPDVVANLGICLAHFLRRRAGYV